MEQCYEYFDCKKSDCDKYKNKDKPCWEYNITSCKSHNDAMNFLCESFDNKIDACELCWYYKHHAKT